MITTVIGNYPKIPNRPRPAKLRNAITRFDSGEITLKDLKGVEDEVTLEVIEEQIDAGVELITDGMIRWEDGQTYLARGIQGFSINGLIRYFDTNTYYRQPVVEGDLEWVGPITARDYEFAQKGSKSPVKAVLTGPYTLALLSKDEHYRDRKRLVMALAKSLSKEAKALEERGVPWIQIDEPALLLNKEDFPLVLEAIGEITQDLQVKSALFLYYDDIEGLYPQILQLPVDLIGLDFVMGEKNFEILRKAPFTKSLGFGIIDARNTKRETVEEIVEKIGKIREIVPLDRIHVSPNCGLEFLPREVAYEKLVLMVKGVNKAKEVYHA
ncbi:methylcobamide--CoM methyltransferase [candidate division TA06 bacterium]|nr:methylcobamide--CoM methyltransferase [candidate division TA06 bacterium]